MKGVQLSLSASSSNLCSSVRSLGSLLTTAHIKQREGLSSVDLRQKLRAAAASAAAFIPLGHSTGVEPIFEDHESQTLPHKPRAEHGSLSSKPAFGTKRSAASLTVSLLLSLRWITASLTDPSFASGILCGCGLCQDE